MTEPSEDGPERNRITDPGLPERPAETADTEQNTLMHQIAVSAAEGIVAEARGRDLLAAQAGDRDGRVAALVAVAAAQADFARVTDAAIEEMRGIAQADHDRLNGLIAHLHRVKAGTHSRS
jgi:hypothetical protein